MQNRLQEHPTNATKSWCLGYHKQPACDFGALILPGEYRQIPQAGGLRYPEEVLNIELLEAAPTFNFYRSNNSLMRLRMVAFFVSDFNVGTNFS